MRTGVDCRGREWEEIELAKGMKNAYGMRFERLTAQFPVMSNNKKQWLCKCDCGNELVVAYNCLSGGNTKSCGCLHVERTVQYWNNRRKENDIIGQTFGELTAIEFVGMKNHEAIYRFKCSCGKYVDRPADLVKRGNTKSCGHLWLDWNDSTKNDIIGQRFGKLVVKSYIGTDKHGSTLFECKCDCGNITILNRYSLVGNRTHSCGCVVSVGESNIKRILTEENIKYKPQYCFTDLLSEVGGHLLYDFAILSSDGQVERLIEFDGQQHIKPYEYFGGEEKFLKVQKNDTLKNQYALSHNIPLVRIPYSKRDSMILNDLLGPKYLIKGGDHFGDYSENDNPN
jgi:hypothetical protein